MACEEMIDMNELENKRYQMLIRVREFGARHASDFPANSFGGQTFSEVGAVITELAGYATTQSVGRGSARERTVSKATARAALYEHLLAINVTARAVALDTPGRETQLRRPRSGTDPALSTAGRARSRSTRCRHTSSTHCTPTSRPWRQRSAAGRAAGTRT